MSRVNLTDTIPEVIATLADRNIGAITVLIFMSSEATNIDPQNTFGALGPILLLDSFEIYGSRIWMLYKDVCGEDIIKTIAMLRATQLGILDMEDLHHAIDHRGEGVDVVAILAKVKDELLDFDRMPTTNKPTTL